MRAAFGSSLSRWDSAKITALLRRAVDEPEYRIAVTTLQGDVAHRAMELMQRVCLGLLTHEYTILIDANPYKVHRWCRVLYHTERGPTS